MLSPRKKYVFAAAGVNILLILLKAIGGILGASAALLADALHSLADLITDIIIAIGVSWSEKPADSNHHYGHYKAESLVTAIAGIIISGGAAVMLLHSVLPGEEATARLPRPWTAVIAAFSIFVCFVTYLVLSKGARKLNSPGIAAAAADKLADSLTSVAAAAGITGSLVFQTIWVDRIASVIVALAVLRTGIKILLRGGHELLDGSPSTKVVDNLKQAVMAVDRVENVHSVRMRSAGGRMFAEIDITTCRAGTVEAGHDLVHEVKNVLLKQFTYLEDVVVHVEPCEENIQQNLQEQIRAIFNECPNCISFHDIEILQSPKGYVATADIQLPENLTVKKAHEIADQLQKKCLAIPRITDAVIHVDYSDDR
jgi:cation diffusion facilitator family transporter